MASTVIKRTTHQDLGVCWCTRTPQSCTSARSRARELPGRAGATLGGCLDRPLWTPSSGTAAPLQTGGWSKLCSPVVATMIEQMSFIAKRVISMLVNMRYLRFKTILTGLFESKFLLGGGGAISPPPPSDLGPEGADCREIFCTDVKTHVRSIATTFFWRKTVYLLCYYDLCKLDA